MIRRYIFTLGSMLGFVLIALVTICSLSAATSVSPILQHGTVQDRKLPVRILQQANSNSSSGSNSDEPPRHDGSSPDDTDVGVIVEDPFNTGRDLLTVGGFVESDQCWIYLDSSDSDSDGRVTNEEYVVFAKLLTGDVLADQEDIETYDDLPLVFQLAFSSTACLCQNPLAGGDEDDADCCVGDNAHIRIPVQPSNNPNTTEANYLYTACSLTQGAAEVYLTSDAPTTPAPVAVTTSAPVAVPVTEAPTSTAPTTAAPITIAPIAAPTLAPVTSLLPSSIPSVTPALISEPPSTAPSLLRSIMPTEGPSYSPSATPVLIATKSPTPPGVQLESMIVYDIAVKNGTNEIRSTAFVSEYFGNLIVAMDALASSVAMNVTLSNATTDGRLLQEVDNGSIVVSLPTELQKVDDISCPSNGSQIDNTTLCQSVSAVIEFVVPDAANATATQSTFDELLLKAVRDGMLQMELDKLEWKNSADQTNPITVLTGLADVPIETPEAPSSAPRELQSTETLSSGQIAGIAIGAGAILSIILGYALMKRSGPLDDDDETGYDDKPKLQEIGPDGDIDIEKDLANASMADSSIYTDAAQSGGGSGAAAVAATTLGASQANYGGMTKEPPAAAIAMQDNYDESGGMLLSDDPERDDDDDGAASSNAGSSGWSSSAGISSLNTGSMDEMDIAAAAGATLAGIGLASAFSRNLSKRGDDALGAAPRYVPLFVLLLVDHCIQCTYMRYIYRHCLCQFIHFTAIPMMVIPMFRLSRVIN